MAETSQRDPLDEIAETVLARVRKGEKPTLQEYVARYPQLANDLEELFPALLLMEQFGSPDVSGGLPNGVTTSTGLRQLGDCVILREVGRGGMGIVYEAEQQSLGRRVALKVLSAGSRFDANQIKRFDREARSVARLEHPGIVPVYSIGNDRGIPFYVMKFINGQGLDEVLDELRLHRGVGLQFLSNNDATSQRPLSAITQALVNGQYASHRSGSPPDIDRDTSFAAWDDREDPSIASSDASPGDLKEQASSTIGVFPHAKDGTPNSTTTEYFRTVAKIAMQVARSLHYAHKQEVRHRDVKPSNLLLDVHGHVWLTDFGLAKILNEDDLTNTGDFVGTLRYTSPEQLRGWSDPRSDIYSLGITVYELLTLHPAFPDRDRTKLLARIAQDDPPSLRRVDRQIPPDLATIVHKSIAKESQQRYDTAEQFAEDLQRFLDDKPIQAKPIAYWQHMRLWARRNPAVAGLSAALLTCLVLALVVVSLLWRRAETEKLAANSAKAERAEQLYQASLSEARAIRYSRQPERHALALAAVNRAAKIRSSIELRNEAISLLAAPGMRSQKEIRGSSLRLTRRFDKYATVEGDNNIVVRAIDDDRELARHAPSLDRGKLQDMFVFAFSPQGRYLTYHLAYVNSGVVTVVIWDTQTNAVALTTQQSGGYVHFAADDSFVAVNKGSATR